MAHETLVYIKGAEKPISVTGDTQYEVEGDQYRHIVTHSNLLGGGSWIHSKGNNFFWGPRSRHKALQNGEQHVLEGVSPKTTVMSVEKPQEL